MFKCNKCTKEFTLKWRLKKHLNIHQFEVNYCHYFNNGKVCPFEEYGCKFKHEESSNCFSGNTCKRKLCQYKHVSVILDKNKSPVKATEKTKSDKNKETSENSNENNIVIKTPNDIVTNKQKF